jgi:C4-dicarboxylate-specific signal transduction histidine kinase
MLVSLILLFVLSAPPASAVSAVQKPTVSIGVLAFRGPEHAMQRWQPVASFLNRSLQQYNFRIIPLNLEQMRKSTMSGELDFILTNPGNYVLLESLYGVSRIATLKRHWQGRTYSQYGAVIFTRRDNSSIKQLRDLRNHSLMVVNNHAFGGFQMAWRELKQAGIDPFSDLSQLHYNGFPQDNIVFSVLAGEVDAGTVRTGLLENLASKGKINLDDVKVLRNIPNGKQFPFLVSTHLYPEWPLAKLSHTPDHLAREIVVALFSANLSEFQLSDAARISWTIPMDYTEVHELMRELSIGPYKLDSSITLSHLIDVYGKWLLAIMLLVVGLSLLSVYVLRVNRRLVEAQHLLTGEVRVRREAESRLEEHRQLLEKRVAERTVRLNDVNAELEADIAARIRVEKMLRDSEETLRELNKIAAEYPVSLEEKIRALLEAGRSHFGFEYGTLYRRTDEGVDVVERVGDIESSAPVELDIDASEFDRLLQDEHMLMTQQPLGNHENTNTRQASGNNCVAVKVIVEGDPFGFLCLADSSNRTRELTKVDRDILQLLADWIGMEIARKQAGDREQQHVSDLAHVSRLGTMGEMASGLAHELNQPLTAISNYIRGMLRRMQSGSIHESEFKAVLEQSADEAERAAEIIRRMRAFVNKDDSLRAPLEMNRLVKRAAAFIAAELESNRIELVLKLQVNESIVMADHIQLEQVLLNLVRNAIDALVEQQQGKRQIVITTQQSNNSQLVTEVRDNAAGLSSADLDRIYDPFYTTKDDGMGLGLSISKTIIEGHGGTMYTDTQDGFTIAGFTLPIFTPLIRSDCICYR